MAITLRSPAFGPGETIPARYTRDGKNPARYTRDGKNLSLPLEWSDAPSGTKSFALAVEDPDAPSGTFRHWGLFNIAADQLLVAEAVGHGGETKDLGLCVNDFGHSRYDGPEPPKGHGVHHYHFRLMALDVDHLTHAPKASIEDVLAAARSHVLGEAELVGTYAR